MFQVKYKSLIYIITFLIQAELCFSVEKDKSFYYDYGKQFYAEAYQIGETGRDSVEALVLFRFSYSLMTFSKSTGFRNNSNSYTAAPNIFIDFRDSSGVIKKREKWTDTVVTGNYDTTKSKNYFYSGYVKVILPKSITAINIEFRNDQYNVLKKEKIAFNTKGNSGGAYILNPLLASADNNLNNSTSPVIEGSQREEYEPFILGGNVDFRSKNARLISPVKYRRGYDSYNYFIEYIPDKSEDIWEKVSPLSGQARAQKSSSLDLVKRLRNKVLFSIQTEFGTATQDEFVSGFLEIPLPAAFMYPGNYVLKVYSADSKNDSLNYYFKVEWVDIPVSLRNADYAAEMMYYILPDEAHEEMTSGTRVEIMRNIWKYWMGNDPTKFTVYNEAMAEYFTRVDYAFFNYQTISEKDGAKTDRGKVYILKDSPTSIKRRLEDDKTIEEWYYNNLKQVYVFETNSAGKYKLKKINPI